MNVIFYLKAQTIYLRLNGQVFPNGRFVYSTGLKINPAHWLDGSIKPGKDDNKRSLLNKIESFILDYPRTFPGDQGMVNLEDELNKKFNPHRLPPPERDPIKGKTVLQLWQSFLESIKGTISPQTHGNYTNSFEAFQAFAEKTKCSHVKPADFNINHYNRYLSYLRAAQKPNTVAKRLKHLKGAFTYIQEDLKIPFGFDLEKIKYKETSGLKIALSEEELQAYIEAADLPPHLVIARDLAVIQCATGLRISDRARVDRSIKGNKIMLKTKKTDTSIEVPITPQVRTILEKYNYELPVLSEQNYRQGIKAIHKTLFPDQTIQVRDGNEFKDVPVHKEISSHDMVRTFITLSAQRGMAIPSIAKITGKSVATLLKNYLVESQKVADKEMEKAWGSAPLKVAR